MPPKVDHEKCIGCGACVSVCPVGVFELKEGKSHVASPDRCTECEQCVKNCPMNAITLEKTKKNKE